MRPFKLFVYAVARQIFVGLSAAADSAQSLFYGLYLIEAATYEKDIAKSHPELAKNPTFTPTPKKEVN